MPEGLLGDNCGISTADWTEYNVIFYVMDYIINPMLSEMRQQSYFIAAITYCLTVNYDNMAKLLFLA